MDTPSNRSSTPYGTAKQSALLRQLAADQGFDDVDSALAVLGTRPPLSVQEASQAIDRLKARTQSSPDAGMAADRSVQGGATKGSGDGARPRFLTARNLLLIHNGAMAMPDHVDTDAAEILQRLARLRDVERVLGALPEWQGINNGGPIEVAHVVDYFGSEAIAAAGFGVSVDTFRGWGKFIPEKRAYEAEVRTRGRVCAPRR